LPEPVDADKAEATLKNGILTIRLPKRAGRAQKIKVKAI
jgi:HSP20 family molecular chaperone IbpA